MLKYTASLGRSSAAVRLRSSWPRSLSSSVISHSPSPSPTLLSQTVADNDLKQIFDNEAYWKAIVNAPSDKSKLSSLPQLPQNPDFYHSFASKLNIFHKSASSNAAETGLFKNPYLTSPAGLQYFTDTMLQNAEKIVDNLVSDTSDFGLRHYVKNLDTLSDILCKVIDLCEFIRISHPNPKFLEIAQHCHERMFNYMNKLNTNVDLYFILNDLLNSPAKLHIKANLSDEEVVVGELLLADFKKSGIDKDDKTRNLFIELSSRISIIGQYFNNNTFDLKDDKIIINKESLSSGLPKETLTQIISEIGTISTRGTKIKFPVNSHISFLLLKSCSDELIRKKIWVALNTSSDKQIQLLELMLNYRKILANKLNYENFNEYQLEDKMAKNSRNVLVFLKNLEKKIKPLCVAELKKLAALKMKDFEKNKNLVNVKEYSKIIDNFEEKMRNRSLSDEEVIKFIRPWDREYLIDKLLINKRRKELLPLTNNDSSASTIAKSNTETSLQNQPISNFFSLGTVLSNLSKFLTHIYGVKFKIDKPLKGEIWHNDVRKLLVVNSKDENDIIGIIYLDLFERLGKSLNPAHFTIVCSRKISNENEIKNCDILNEPKIKELTEEENNETQKENNEVKYIQCVRNSNDEIYQLPIITLVCNFSKSVKEINNSFERISLLTLTEVETLFHEIGHSLHSMFGKTDLHNVSGTRCLTDFVELPSILMETFSKDARVLKFLSEHHAVQFNNTKSNNSSTDVAVKDLEDKFKDNLINLHQNENDVLKYCDIYSQLKMAYLDQQLYLKTPQPVLLQPSQNGGQRQGKIVQVGAANSDLITIDTLDRLVASNLDYSKQIYHDVEKELQIFADEESTWYGKFGHLFTYGATYYTYLFDRAISSKIYKDLFLQDPFNHQNGKIFKDSVLKWGGSKNPWECIAECLEEPKLKKGDEQSMKLIGEVDDVK